MKVVGWLPLLLLAAGCVWSNRGEEDCTPRSCSENSCGVLGDDGCGEVLDCGGCSSGTCGANACIQAEQEAPPAVRVIGRTRQRSDGSHKLSFPGVTFEARFHGTAISARIEDTTASRHTNYFTAQVDDRAPTVFAVREGDHLYELASGLPPGDHYVRLTKRTEGLVGSVAFHGFDLHGGELLSPPAPRRRMVVIGDSITTGYGILGSGPSCPFDAGEEDVGATYASLTARDLAAELVTVAAAGMGVLRNVDGSDTETMFEVYDRANTYEPDSPWDPRADEADVVVIHLGTNDFGIGAPEQTAFVQRYLALISKVRGATTIAPIVLALSPMLSDGYPRDAGHRTRAREYLQAVVTAAHARGDPLVSLVEFDTPAEDEPYGCEWHPGPGTHRRMADALTAHLRTLSW